MPPVDRVQEEPSARFEWQRSGESSLQLCLLGRLDADSTPRLWAELEQFFVKVRAAQVTVDGARLEYCDGAGLALLHHLGFGHMTPGASVSVAGLRPELTRLYQNFTVADYAATRPTPLPKPHAAEDVGRAAAFLARNLKLEVSFIGEVAQGFAANAIHLRSMRWGEVWRIFEQAGANALPIVSLISILVGLIIAFEAAQPLAQFGAQIFIANMIGLLMIRELGPLMTAILLAGRSGSAFAAELGTMKVNEELNALNTMGLDPVRFLVVQRILAGVLLTPVLTLYAMFMGVFGGVFVMVAMGFPLTAIYTQMASSVTTKDVIIGTSKGLIFGAIVSAVGCLRGLQTQKGPSAVGESTTRAVVSSILLIIIADAIYALILYVFER